MMPSFLAPFLKPLYGYIAAGVLAFLIGFAWYWDHNGASRVQARFDTYVAEIKAAAAAEAARQAEEAAKAQAALQDRLDQAEAESESDREQIAKLQAWLLGAGLTGRGATPKDVELLNGK